MKLELRVTRREKSMFSRVKSMMEELRDTCQSREVPEEGGDRVDAGRFALGRERERDV